MEFLKEPLGQELYAQVFEKLKGNDKIQLANIAEGKYIEVDKYNTEKTLNGDLQVQLSNIELQ